MTKRPRRGPVLAGAALAASLCVPTARAQMGTWNLDRPPEETSGPVWAINYDAAYASPAGPDGPSKQGSVAFQLSYERRAYEALWGGVEIGHQFGHKLKGRTAGRYAGDVDGDGQKDYLDFNSDVVVKVFHLTPYLRLGKVFGQAGHFRMRHTVLLGAGLYYTSSNEGTFTLTGRTSRGNQLRSTPMTYGAAHSANLGLNFGSALDFWVRDGFSFGAELRYHNIFGAPHMMGYLMPIGRLTFLF